MDLTIYDQFVKDYNNPNITGEDVRRRCGLNPHRYSEIRQIAINNGDIPSVRRMNRTDAKFYTKQNEAYVVKKQFGNECLVVGRFPNQSTAELVVEECKKHNWKINEIRDFIDEHKIKPRNYSFTNNQYTVQKSIKGKNVVFCRVDTESTAQKVVSELRKCNWDYAKVDEILREVTV